MEEAADSGSARVVKTVVVGRAELTIGFFTTQRDASAIAVTCVGTVAPVEREFPSPLRNIGASAQFAHIARFADSTACLVAADPIGAEAALAIGAHATSVAITFLGAVPITVNPSLVAILNVVVTFPACVLCAACAAISTIAVHEALHATPGAVANISTARRASQSQTLIGVNRHHRCHVASIQCAVIAIVRGDICCVESDDEVACAVAPKLLAVSGYRVRQHRALGQIHNDAYFIHRALVRTTFGARGTVALIHAPGAVPFCITRRGRAHWSAWRPRLERRMRRLTVNAGILGAGVIVRRRDSAVICDMDALSIRACVHGTRILVVAFGCAYTWCPTIVAPSDAAASRPGAEIPSLTRSVVGRERTSHHHGDQKHQEQGSVEESIHGLTIAL